MLNIVVGDNATGKTKVLKEIYSKHKNEAVTNFVYDCRSKYVTLSKTKVALVDEVLDDIKLDSNRVIYGIWEDAIRSEILCEDALSIISLLCKDRRYILIDEPERCISPNQLKSIVWLLNARNAIDDDVWITTHAVRVVGVNNAVYYKVDKDGKLCKLEKGEVYEYVIPI